MDAEGNVKAGEAGSAFGELLQSVQAAHERQVEREAGRGRQSIAQCGEYQVVARGHGQLSRLCAHLALGWWPELHGKI